MRPASSTAPMPIIYLFYLNNKIYINGITCIPSNGSQQNQVTGRNQVLHLRWLFYFVRPMSGSDLPWIGEHICGGILQLRALRWTDRVFFMRTYHNFELNFQPQQKPVAATDDCVQFLESFWFL
ncbi:hypothetical protein HS088_TW02G00330 [Tripterygium wilfordii]|uniref:Uncharacterized protein n=1 Tax=Tripterygium wilfordii TaxID=458696 RepID=A0A7J7DYA5_TRIWF|nr:hypothetical protein HS088_TW02G00330 [Tripterygium wilfordii]